MRRSELVDLDGRVEFGSREWFDELRSAFDTILKRADVADGAHFAASEVYTNAPPHLGLPGNVLAFQMIVEGRRAQVVEGESADCPWVRRADYNDGQVLGATCYGEDPGMRVRAWRELAHRCRQRGDDSMSQQMTGLVLPDGLADVLTEVHDHMARRTLPNPDLDNRIDSFALGRHRDELLSKGCTVIENAISADGADELRAAIVGAMRESGGSAAGRLLERGRIFEEAALHPSVVTLVEVLLDRGFLLSTSLGVKTAGGVETAEGEETGEGFVTTRPRIDYPLIESPFPSYCMVVSTMWALDDVDGDAARGVFAPGSFTENRHPASGTRADGFEPLRMRKGSIALWHGATWHAAPPRPVTGSHVTLHNTYSRMFMRPIDDYSRISSAVVRRNPPQLATLCGLDDLFGKSDESGPFMRGHTYAQRYLKHREPHVHHEEDGHE